MRLLAGLLAGQPFETHLVGDASLSRRPMERVIAPLSQMGANIVGEGPNQTAPLKIKGAPLKGIQYTIPITSAQVKGALLLAGLFAKGKTTVNEPAVSRNHTELMLNYFRSHGERGRRRHHILSEQPPDRALASGRYFIRRFLVGGGGSPPGGQLLCVIVLE